MHCLIASSSPIFKLFFPISRWRHLTSIQVCMFVSSRLGCRYPFHQFLTFFLPAAALLLTLFSFSSPLSIHWAANINTTTILTLTTHEFFSASVFLLSLSSQNLEQHFKKSLQRATISSGVTQRQHWFTSITFPLRVSQKITVSQHYNRSTSDLAHLLSSSH